MSKINFNLNTDTVPVDEFRFAGSQKTKADHHNVLRVFLWRDLRGNADRLPTYVKQAVQASGYTPVCIGGTTYSHSVIGLYRTVTAEVIR